MNPIAGPGTVPLWRLCLWAIIAMGGVAYLVLPDSGTQRIVVWGAILVSGAFVVGFGLLLNWTQSDRMRVWARQHPRLVYRVFMFAILASALVKIMDIVLRKR